MSTFNDLLSVNSQLGEETKSVIKAISLNEKTTWEKFQEETKDMFQYQELGWFCKGYSFREIIKEAKRADPEDFHGPFEIITDFLYLGGALTAASPLRLKNCGIRYILNLSCLDNFFEREEQLVEYPGIEPFRYLRIVIDDNCKVDIRQYFNICAKFINMARDEHERVYVHCYAGISRSVTIILAYLASIGRWNIDDELMKIKTLHSWKCQPNPAFMRQLYEYADDLKKGTYSTQASKSSVALEDPKKRFYETLDLDE
ncbi:7351_t:CDS:2 [Ambispora leptoticha]|uniref:protein-tyrosine-phosphatase n=1 Tax=Ambispora leptoticha TaxID=144679 RepID=A0A9N9AXT7_9GLOM|nr:7351_t:CDS:2 [Ambispora leptoticha]